MKQLIQAILGRFGYRLKRIKPKVENLHYDPARSLPIDAKDILRADNPDLLDLDRRYAGVDSAVTRHTQWALALKGNAEVLSYFRGDTMYVWAYRALGDDQRRFYIFATYIRALDVRGLMGTKLTEDGSFGCFTYDYSDFPTVSRDLLDSLNEIYFLDRECGLLSRPGMRILDIGAGYGRLAHRVLSATDTVDKYWCIDAVPRSTFLCDYHLKHLGWAGTEDSRAQVVPLDEKQRVKPGSIDLAINVHSFSEMCYDAIQAWIDWLVELEVPRLFIIPNQAELLSTEEDLIIHRDFSDILERAGYRRIAHEPTLKDENLRELVGVRDFFWLFERS